MTFTPTPEQSAILSAATGSADNLLIKALAGAAKTSTLVLIAEALPRTSILCVAFNRKIADEMKLRLPSNCEAKTLNALGHRAWADTTGKRLKLDTGKTYRLLKAAVDALDNGQKMAAYEGFSDLLKVIDAGKAAGYIPTGHYPNAKRLLDDDEFFQTLDEEPTVLEETLIRAVTLESLKESFSGTIDFNDQILMPTVFSATFPQYPLVLIDEAQDLSALNHAMLRKFARKRLIAVGDECQPAGTKVSVVKRIGDRWNNTVVEQKNIEDLKIGDKLVGYDTDYSEFLFNRVVEGVTATPFEGDLITVLTPKGVTSYTPNHHCFANFAPLRDKTALYLMQKNGRWRVGTAKMDYKSSSGPIARARAEGAHELWLLSVFDTRSEALQAEAAVQALYGIPDITFNWAGMASKGYADPVALENVWKELDSIDFHDRAEALLKNFHREMRYPLWTAEKGYMSLKRPFVVHACNLITGCELLPYEGKKREKLSQWVPCEIRYKYYNGMVYSLKVSHNHLFIADGFVTHNCQAIYGFRGAHEDSMRLLREQYSMKEFPLSISFRCPIAVVESARWRAPTMQYAAWAQPGEVRHLTEWSADSIPDEAAIICRNNAPLFSTAIRLLKHGRYPELVGNDIGKVLIKWMKKLGDERMTQAQALVALTAWEAAKAAKARDPSKVADQAACMEVFIRQGRTLGDAIAYAEHILNQRGPVKLMTGHRAKGLEFPHVFFLDQELVRNEGQDRNLRYVIITRAQQTLNYINSEDFEDMVEKAA